MDAVGKSSVDLRLENRVTILTVGLELIDTVNSDSVPLTGRGKIQKAASSGSVDDSQRQAELPRRLSVREKESKI